MVADGHMLSTISAYSAIQMPAGIRAYIPTATREA